MLNFKEQITESTQMRLVDLLPKKVKRMIYRVAHQDKYKGALLMMKALRKDPDVITRGLSKQKIQAIAADHFGLNHREFARVLDRKTRYEEKTPARSPEEDEGYVEEYITEAPLSRGQLAKNPVRVQNFIKKVNKGTPFDLVDGGEVVLHKDMAKGVQTADDIPSKVKDVDGNILAWNKLEKTADFGGQGSSGEPSGAEWEALIAVGVNRAVQGKDWRLGSDEWQSIEKFWDNYGEFADKLGEEFKKRYKLKGLKQLGASTAATHKEWPGNDRTPKTDIISTDGKVHISLKKSGGSQLMSGQNLETLGTFNAALATYSGENPRGIIKLMNDIEKKMGKMATNDSITSLKKLRSSGDKLSPADQAKISEFESLDTVAKDLTAQMQKVFSGIPFKSHFCWEAATGAYKFQPSPDAVATHVVTFDPSGNIEADLVLDKISTAGAYLAKKNNFYVSFKGGGKPALVTRTTGVKESFADIIRDECSEFLTEEMQQLDEFALFDRLKKRARGVSDAIKNKAGEILDRVMARVSQAFNAMKKLGERMLSALLEFFNLKVDKIDVKGGGEFPLV